MSFHIYDGVERDVNPQLIFADPLTVYAQTANSHGIPQVMLYLYPPTLADLLVPLTIFSPSTAFALFSVFDLFLIVALSVSLVRMLGMRSLGSVILVSITVLLFRPTLNSIHWGEIVIMLLFLLIVGLSLYVNGHKGVAMLLFALAIAIKLIPIIIIIPLIAWRDWKSLRTLAVWSAVIFATVWVVNGGSALSLYFLHQLPSMSSGQLGSGIYWSNRTLGNIFFNYLSNSNISTPSTGLVWLVRLISALVLCCAGWLSQSSVGEALTSRQQTDIVIIFLLLTCCISPYSWLYAYTLAAPAVVMYSKRAWERSIDTVEIVIFMGFLLSLSTTKLHMPMVTPLLGILLGTC